MIKRRKVHIGVYLKPLGGVDQPTLLLAVRAEVSVGTFFFDSVFFLRSGFLAAISFESGLISMITSGIGLLLATFFFGSLRSTALFGLASLSLFSKEFFKNQTM